VAPNALASAATQEKKMDIRKIFEAVSDQLLASFKKSSVVKHHGGKGEIREASLRDFLKEYLPQRYAVGSGEVISSENRVSPELDIVIYDPLHCPTLVRSESHAVYPEESVYGAISVKSHLNAGELKEAYENLRGFKTIISRANFTYQPHSGMSIGFGYPVPVTGIVAYGANRSLEAIAEQVKALDSDLQDRTSRPDFVAIIGQGIIGPREPLRGEFNQFNLSDDPESIVALRKTGRHTLLRLYMQILRELNALTLRPLELQKYDDMPRLIGEHRVGRHNRFVRVSLDGTEIKRVIRFNEAAIREIVSKSKLVSLKQHYLNHIGHIPHGIEVDNTNVVVYEYNPKALPPMNFSSVKLNESGIPVLSSPAFQPIFLTIDGKQYAVDIGSLADEHFDEDDDFTADELLSG
jgi:hypothetical protein